MRISAASTCLIPMDMHSGVLNMSGDSFSLRLSGSPGVKSAHHSVWRREDETETQRSHLQRGARSRPGDE